MSIFIVLLFYYGIASIITIKKEYNFNENLAILFALIPAFVLIGFRGIDVGSDTWFYAHGFESIASHNTLLEAIKNSRYEVGFVFINFVCAKIGFSYNMLQILITFFICVSIGIFLKRYSLNVWVSSFVFYTLRYMLGPMNTVRMWIAIAILLFAIPYLQKQQLIRFFIIVLIACLFHSTALIFAVLYPLSKLKITKNKIVILISTALAIGYIGTPFFAWLTQKLNMYSGYLTSVYFVYDNNIAVYFTLAIDLCLLLFIFLEYRKDSENKSQEDAEIDLIPIENIIKIAILLIVAIDIVGLKNTIMNRISTYFGMFWIVGIPSALKRIDYRHNREVVWIVMGMLLSVQFLIVLIFRPGWNSVVPYHFFVNN